MKACSIALLTLLLIINFSFAQSSFNFDSLILSNVASFKATGQFNGKGWDQLITKAQRTDFVLIGEDHFISEVPLFTQGLMQRLKFDSYICEIDPWTASIFKSKITMLTDAQLDKWISANYNGFSFFQKKNEFEMMRHLLSQKINLVGLEQVGLMSTTIIFQYLSETGSQKNRRSYELMRDSSRVSNDRFFADQSKPFFLSTAFFNETIEKLNTSAMTADEAELIAAIRRSAEIYKTGSHSNRIKLMQSNLVKYYPEILRGKKNLFKFGANHAMKGESYLPVYDIGTTAHVLAQSQNQDSYHILILPKSGSQAGFIGGTNVIDMNEEPYKALKPFFEKSADGEWTFFDLEIIRSAVRRGKFSIEDPFLEKTIKGYDALVVIPVCSPAEAIR